MGPRGFWIALAIVLFYLIARPHVGTVWRVTLPPPPSGATPDTPPAGFVPDTPSPHAFVERIDCEAAANEFRSSGGQCVPENALLWGW